MNNGQPDIESNGRPSDAPADPVVEENAAEDAPREEIEQAVARDAGAEPDAPSQEGAEGDADAPPEEADKGVESAPSRTTAEEAADAPLDEPEAGPPEWVVSRPSILDDKKNLNAFVQSLHKLKERSTLRAVAERELLLNLIQAHESRLANLPASAEERQGLVDLLCSQAKDSPAQDSITRLTTRLHHLINQHSIAVKNGAKGEALRLSGEVRLSEDLLVKSFQAVANAASELTSGLRRIVPLMLGEKAAADLEELSNRLHHAEGFWKRLVEETVVPMLNQAYEKTVAEKKYSFSRGKSVVSLNILLDDILAQLEPADEATPTSQAAKDAYERKRRHKVVFDLLAVHKGSFLAKKQPVETLSAAAWIACLDPTAAEYREAIISEPPPIPICLPNDPDCAAANSPLRLMRLELVYAGFGAHLALTAWRRDLDRGLRVLGFSEKDAAAPRLDGLDDASLKDMIAGLLELGVLYLLDSRSQAMRKKVDVRIRPSLYLNRKEALALEGKHGLTRIQRRMLLRASDADQDKLFFLNQTPEGVEDFIRQHGLAPAAAQRIRTAFGKARRQVEFCVRVDMDMVARTTPDSKRGLMEVLEKYSIGQPRRRQPR